VVIDEDGFDYAPRVLFTSILRRILFIAFIFETLTPRLGFHDLSSQIFCTLLVIHRIISFIRRRQRSLISLLDQQIDGSKNHSLFGNPKPYQHLSIMLFSTRFTAILAMIRMVSAQAPPTATGPAGATGNALRAKAAIFNQDFFNYIFIIIASLIAALTIWRVGIESVKYVRTLTCLNNDTQRYFASPSKTFASFKKNLIYAPIFSKRHNREFQLSAAMNVGTLPTRLQFLFLMSYFGTNVAFCVVSITWNQPLSTVTGQLRNRTGILAVVNMVSNPLTSRLYILFTIVMGLILEINIKIRFPCLLWRLGTTP